MTCWIASLIRVRAIRARDPPPLHQRRGVKPLIQQRQPAGDLPPQITADRLGALPVRQVLQRLQGQHRRHPGRRNRGTTDRGEQIRVLLVREQLGCDARPETRTSSRRDQCPTTCSASHSSRSGLSTPCTKKITPSRPSPTRSETPPTPTGFFSAVLGAAGAHGKRTHRA